eukprot:365318-Chlamydomonas_euryale.AAC.2
MLRAGASGGHAVGTTALAAVVCSRHSSAIGEGQPPPTDDVQKQDGHIVVLQRERLQVGQALFGVGAAHELEHVAGEHVLEHAQLRLRQLRHAQLAQRARSDVRLHHQHRLRAQPQPGGQGAGEQVWRVSRRERGCRATFKKG